MVGFTALVKNLQGFQDRAVNQASVTVISSHVVKHGVMRYGVRVPLSAGAG